MKKAAVILLACLLLPGCACASAEDADVHAAKVSERDVYIARVLNDCLEMDQVERAGIAVTQGYAVFGGDEHIRNYFVYQDGSYLGTLTVAQIQDQFYSSYISLADDYQDISCILDAISQGTPFALFASEPDSLIVRTAEAEYRIMPGETTSAAPESTDADLLERAVFTDVDFSIARSDR